MLLSLRQDHKDHLNLLASKSTQVTIDFCNLARDFVNNGPNNKLYKKASEELQVDIEVVQNCVFGLVNLLILSCKHKLSDADFRDSIITLGFNNEQQQVLHEFYYADNATCKEIADVLEKQALQEDHCIDLDWRFEVQVSSRSLLHQVNPLIAIDLSLQSTSENTSKSKLLQADPTNLVNITNKLKAALNESRTSYSRKVQNAFLET